MGKDVSDAGADRVGSRLRGRRVGKPLRSRQADRMQRLLPQIAVPREGGDLDPRQLFAFAPHRLVMEIGFGGGENLAAAAAAQPATGFVGCEPFLNGVSKLLVRIEDEGLDNIRLHSGDALDLLLRLRPGSLDRVDLFYPDPWPKRRHHKRRFVTPASLAALARALPEGATFRCATDIDDYAAWVLARVAATPWFAWQARSAADWRQPWPDFVRTRYEDKAVREGRRSVYLTFVRTAAAASGVSDAGSHARGAAP